jgi:CO/xanthine dehydrogenase FAD-binding subunit
MKNFKHEKAASFEEASALLNESPQNVVMSGGTDLLGQLKDSILVNYPEKVIDLKHIPGADGITKDSEKITTVALTKLVDIGAIGYDYENIPCWRKPQNRCDAADQNMGTIGGNICQDVRCWFYRYPHEAGGTSRLLQKRRGHLLCTAGGQPISSIFEA